MDHIGWLKINLKKLIIIPIILFCLTVKGTNYYVNNNGNDSNTGLSDSQAWAHHPWMSTWTGKVVLTAGDIVSMKRGNIWTIANPVIPYVVVAQSGKSGSPILTNAYGAGDAPIIKISTASDQPVFYISGQSYLVFDNLHVQHHSSSFAPERYGFVLVNVCHNVTFTNNEIDHIPYSAIQSGADSYYITVGDTTATSMATSTSFSNNIHDFGYGGVILSGVNPVSSESHFSVYYNYIHDATNKVAGENEYGILFSANAASSGWPKYAIARYNRVENIDTWECLDIHSGSYIYFIDNYIKNFGTVGILIACKAGVGDLPPTSNHLYIERNIIEQTPSGWVPGHENAFICQFPDGIYYSSNVFIRDNILFYTSRPPAGDFCGIRAGGGDNITISGNKIYSGSTASGHAGIYLSFNEGSSGNKDVTITNNFIGQWGPGIEVVGSSITGSVSISNNIITQPSRSASLFISGKADPIPGSLRLYNNTFINSGDYSNILEMACGINSDGSVTVKNNIMGYSSSYAGRYCNLDGTISGIFTSDNNLYWGSNYANPFYQGGKDRNWTYWTTNLGYDTHSIGPNSDPLFKNSSGSFTQDIDFELKGTSIAVNKGTDVGLTTDYAGSSISGLPDIGAFEISSVPSIPTPVFLNSVIENATPSIIELTYNINLANILPAPSSFNVRVNSVTINVNSISISGTKVFLSLSTDIAFGDNVIFTYTKPSTNQLQTAAGGQATTLTTQSVTNNVSPAKPVFVSSVIEKATPSKLEMTYNLTLANIIPPASAFSVRVNSLVRTVNEVAVSGTKVMLTLASPIVYANTVTVSYSKPPRNPLTAVSGGEAVTITLQPVTNNTINVSPASSITSPANNSVFLASSNITITASASDADGSVTLVELYTGSTLLGSMSAAPYTFNWNNVSAGTYSLTVVAIDNFYAKTRSVPISITINEPPLIRISNPLKGSNYKSPATIEIDVAASDPDGSITKVELYSGTNHIAELTGVSYSYVWKGVSKGIYTITAIATDNLNATTTSDQIEFTVEDVPRYDGNSEIVNLYPNPNDGHFSVEFVTPLQNEPSEIIITDLDGKMIYLEALSNLETLRHFDLSYIKSGIYIMMIMYKEILVTKKFIIR